MPEIIFSKQNYKYEILNHLYFGPSFLFGGTAIRRFRQCFVFLIFHRQSTMVADIFTRPSFPSCTYIHRKAEAVAQRCSIKKVLYEIL